MIVAASPDGAGADDTDELELAGAELAGELTDTDPPADDESGALETGATAAELLLEDELVAGGAALLELLAVPWEQAVSNASSAAVPVIRVELLRRFTDVPLLEGRRRCRPWMCLNAIDGRN